MEVFWYLFTYLTIVVLFTYRKSGIKKIRISQTVLCGFGLWLILALRDWCCGTDLFNDERGGGYITGFYGFAGQSISSVFDKSVNSYYEYGFCLYNWIIANLISSIPQIYIALTALVEIGLIGYTIYKNSKNIPLSFFVFACFGLYIFSFTGLRQTLAFSLTFFAYNYIRDEKPYKFAALVVLASTLHSSAFMFIFSWFLRNKTLSFNKGILYFFLVIASIPFLKTIVSIVTSTMLGGERYADYGNDAGGAYNLFIIYGLVFLGSFMFGNKNSKNGVIHFYRWMALISFFCQSTGIISAGSMTRMGFYFAVFYLLLIPEMFDNLKSTSTKHLFNITTTIILVLFFYLTTKNGMYNVVPYHFFWEFMRAI